MKQRKYLPNHKKANKRKKNTFLAIVLLILLLCGAGALAFMDRVEHNPNPSEVQNRVKADLEQCFSGVTTDICYERSAAKILSRYRYDDVLTALDVLENVPAVFA